MHSPRREKDRQMDTAELGQDGPSTTRVTSPTPTRGDTVRHTGRRAGWVRSRSWMRDFQSGTALGHGQIPAAPRELDWMTFPILLTF